ncbi:MFS transporter [Paenibacillus selenitireducens]|uniref:MFS transporter n=1 Tax=Paenibacillus selenitireducens TaxID=1324314 RepID=A0A1T2X7E4_9BACL|nr:MFS transporter [Paenibacillus selenitireducens]
MIVLRWLLNLLQVVFYSTNAILLPYLPLLLQAHGFSSLETGTLLTMGPFLAMFAQPIAGMLSDRIKSTRPLLIVLWLFMGVSAYLLFMTESRSIAAVSLVALYIFYLPAVSLLDALTVKSALQWKASYSSVRLWGSVGFMLTLVVLGQRFDAWGGVQSLIWMFSPIWISVFLIFLFLQEPKGDIISGPAEPALNLKMLRQTLANPSIFIFFILIFLLAMPHRMNDTLLSLHMQHLGASASQISWAWAVAGASEIVGFYIMARIVRKSRIVNMLTIVALLYAIRWVLYMFITDPGAIVILQITHMFTYVAVWVLAIEYIAMSLPRQMVATGQALLSMVFLGLGGLAGGSLGGGLQEKFGEASMYGMGVVCATLAFIGFCVWNRRRSQKTESARV